MRRVWTGWTAVQSILGDLLTQKGSKATASGIELLRLHIQCELVMLVQSIIEVAIQAPASRSGSSTVRAHDLPSANYQPSTVELEADVSLIFPLRLGFVLLLLYAKSDAGSAMLQPRMQGNADAALRTRQEYVPTYLPKHLST